MFGNEEVKRAKKTRETDVDPDSLLRSQMPVYKYLKKKHLESFRQEGTIAIGNIGLHRDIENEKIKDPYEGRTVYLIGSEDEAIELSIEQVNAISNDYHVTATLRINQNSYFRSELNAPNVFVFSTSCNFDDELMKALGYDTSYQISDIYKFHQILYKEINKRYPLILSAFNKVNYVKTKEIKVTNENKDQVIRTTAYDKSVSDRIKQIYIEDYLIKLEAFKNEEEFRFIFVPVAEISKDPIFIKCNKLLDCCRFYPDVVIAL